MEAPRQSAFIVQRTKPKTPKVRYFLGITENSKDKQGKKIGISLEYPDLFKIARVMEEAALAILGWRKDIEGRREPNGHDPATRARLQRGSFLKMYYIIHIATAFQSFKAQPREIQELIWTRTLNDLRKKDPTHPYCPPHWISILPKKPRIPSH